MGNTYSNTNTSPLSTHGKYVLGNYTPILNYDMKIAERSMCDKALNKCATPTCENSAHRDSPICKPCYYVILNAFDIPTSTKLFKAVCGNTTHCNNQLAALNRHACLFCESKICNECIKSIKTVDSNCGVPLTTNYCCDSCYTALNKYVKKITMKILITSKKASKGLDKAVEYNIMVHRDLHNK